MTLREISPADTEDLFRWRSQDRVRPFFYTAGAASFEQHRAFVEAYFAEGNDDRWFVIEENGVARGALAFYRPDPVGQEWEAGRIVLSPECRGSRGLLLARRAIALLQEDARLGGHTEMTCEVLDDNRTMLAIVESLGFVTRSSGVRDGRSFQRLAADLGAAQPPGEALRESARRHRRSPRGKVAEGERRRPLL